MRNADQWKPTRVVREKRSGRFLTNRAKVFGGSIYIAQRQHEEYIPLLQEYVRGHVLDIGCGPVPYYEVYRDKATQITCVDWEGSLHAQAYVDQFVDLNIRTPLPFPDGTFDSAVASDLIMHLKYPDHLMGELFRVLKPGGQAFISAPAIYWTSEPPNEYFHPSEWGLRRWSDDAGFEVVHLASYGGHVDVLMDVLNKFMEGGLRNRMFLLFARLVRWTGWPRRNRAKANSHWAQGHCMVVRKAG